MSRNDDASTIKLTEAPEDKPLDYDKTSNASDVANEKVGLGHRRPSYMEPVERGVRTNRHSRRRTAEETEAIKLSMAAREPRMKKLFHEYTKGKPLMDGRTFVQFARNAGLMKKHGKSRALTVTDLDLAHAKARKTGSRGIEFSQFQNTIIDLADRSNTDVSELLKRLETAPKPKFKGTGGSCRFYDDTSTYTGTFAHGGPPTINDAKERVFDISQCVDTLLCHC